MLRSRWISRVAVVLLGAVFASFGSFASAQSSAQLDALKSMSSADRAALMKQMGIDPSAMGAGGTDDSAKDKKNDLKPRRKSSADKEKEDVDLAEAETDPITGLPRPPKRFKPGDTLLLEVELQRGKPAQVIQQPNGLPPVNIPAIPEPELTAEQKIYLEQFMTSLRDRNPYRLDAEGVLSLPGVRPVAIGGLTDEQASKRIAAESVFAKLVVKVERLPVQPYGAEALKPFGYDLFDEEPSTFAPVSDVPVPADYVLGPGDQLVIQLFGSQNRSFKLAVNAEGRVNVPDIGPVSVVGKTFESARADIEARIARQFVGTQASVSLADTRAIRVFVVGEAKRPGAYTVSGLSTVTSALYAAGGVKRTGSLRDVQLKRRGQIVRHLDLYDLLLRGDTSNDAPLQSGDAVFIPPVGATAAVEGEVQRPAIYELRGATTMSGLVGLAGGLTSAADSSVASLVRIDDQRMRIAINVPLDTAAGRDEKIRNGDAVRIGRLRPTLDAGVTLEGYVFRPGTMAWRQGMRLTDALRSLEELRPNADLNYVLVRREMPPDRHVVFLSADLAAALRNPGSKADLALAARDRIIVFDANASRKQLMDPLLAEVRRQSDLATPTAIVSIGGRVKMPGDYPLEPGMRVSDLLRAGGRLEDAAFPGTAELARYRTDGKERITELLDIDLAAILKGSTTADVVLQAFDTLTIKELPEWSLREQVAIKGEVRFPGVYPIRRGETLRSVLERAGGLTSLAFEQGAVFTRRDLQEREQKQIDELSARLKSDLASTAVSLSQSSQGGAQSAQALTAAQGLLGQLETAKPVGRLVVDLKRVLAGGIGSEADVALRDGDTLVVPGARQEVTVLGEVQNSTSHLYRKGLDSEDYIRLSGGLTRKADDSRIYVVRADGSVVANMGGGWFRRGSRVTIQPGDTIVAPIDTDRLPTLPLWQTVTTIVYNVAIAAKAVGLL